MAGAPDGCIPGGVGLLPCGSHLNLSGIPSQCAYTPFWDSSFRSGAFLGNSSSSACSIIYRGRGPEPGSLLSCFLGGFRLDDRALPLGRISKNAYNPLLEVEVVNAVGVCYFDQLLSDHPLSLCTQPRCCCCSARLPTDPDPYGLCTESKKAAAATAAACNRRVTVIEELLPYEALQDDNRGLCRTPVLVLPCGAAHSAIELVAIKHNVGDVVYSRGLPPPPTSAASTGHESRRPERSGPRRLRQQKRNRRRSRSSGTSSGSSGSNSTLSDFEYEPVHLPDWGTSLQTAGCSLGLEGRRLAELHPHTFQWTRGKGRRLLPEGSRSCERCSTSSTSCNCCCWCPMVCEVNAAGAVRNIFERGEARHAPDPIDTIKPKESVVSERLLEVRTDDKHPFLKLLYARNSRGFFVARLRHNEEALDADEAEAAIREAAGRKSFIEAPSAALEGFADGGLRRQLEIQVLHDAPYGYRVPRQEGGLTRHKDREAGTLRVNVPKQLPAHPTVINVAVSPADVGEAALLYSSQFVSLWKAEEARMEVQVPVSLALATRNIRRTVRPSMRYRQRAAFADPALDSFQTLCYLPHRRQTLLLGSDNLWALDLRAKGITRLFPALHSPTHGGTLQSVAEAYYAPCTAYSRYHTAFTALAPHPTQAFLLAAVHDATESVYLFDTRAMHEPLTVVGLPTIRKTGARYRSLLWHSSTDQWAEAHKLEAMTPTSFMGRKARAAAVATAGRPGDETPSTHDILAAFSWRSEDVICSAFRVHPAYCPPDPVHPSHTSRQRDGPETPIVGRWHATDPARPQGRPDRRPRFEPSPLAAVREHCLPTILSREVVEVSWQAEVSMFPRVSWGLENRERCYPIPSRTPLGSSWTKQPPLHVTVDEHTATATFHGFAGACLFDLPITPELRSVLLYEGRQPPPRRLRCKTCGNRTRYLLPAERPSPGDLIFCEKCSSPINGFGGRLQEPNGSLAVLGALTTSGRLTCRPLTLNDPLLQLKLQRRRRLYASLARRQGLSRNSSTRADSAEANGLNRPADNSHSTGLPESLAAVLSFHARRPNNQTDTLSIVRDEEDRTAAFAGHEAIPKLLGHLQGSSNEMRVLPQRVPLLLLQAQLQQRLQRELLFLAALRWKRGQQLQLLRRAQLEGHLELSDISRTEVVHLLKRSLVMMSLSLQWPRKLASFDFCDSGALGLHQPAFLAEAYDPEPVVQMVLADPRLDAILDHHLFSLAGGGSPEGQYTDDVLESTSKGLCLDAKASPAAAGGPDTTDAGSVEPSHNDSLIAGKKTDSNTRVSTSKCLDELEEEQIASCARAAGELLETRTRKPRYTAVSEVSALAFPTARSRAVFRYAVKAVRSLSYVTSEQSLLQLRDEDNALLQDVLVAVQLWRDRILTDSQTLSLLQRFTNCRPNSPCLLDMQRTTLPLGFSLPHSPQAALEAAMRAIRAHSLTGLSAPQATGEDTSAIPLAPGSEAAAAQGSSAENNSDGASAAAHANTNSDFVRVANPAVTPMLRCCCRIMLEHHCDVHSCTQDAAADDWRNTAEGKYPVMRYPQTDGMQALLQLLKTETEMWLRRRAERLNGGTLSSACFLPQALVDELSEILFLTHEVLLLPRSEVNSHAINGAYIDAIQQGAGDQETSAGVSADRRALRASDEQPGLRIAADSINCANPMLPNERHAYSSAGDALNETTCPLASPWLPACCLSRHLHSFIRSDRLLADDDQLQEELQRQAWPELLQQQQRSQPVEATQGGQMGQFSRFPHCPSLDLPESMQSHLPEHVLEGLARCKWGRLLSGIAINDAIIADLLRHWDVSAVQHLNKEREEQREARVGTKGEGQMPDFHRAIRRLPSNPPGPVDGELERLLLLLPRTPEGVPVFASVQARQQEQHRIRAERQQLLDTIARAMR